MDLEKELSRQRTRLVTYSPYSFQESNRVGIIVDKIKMSYMHDECLMNRVQEPGEYNQGKPRE